jgi:hypothetical protein
MDATIKHPKGINFKIPAFFILFLLLLGSINQILCGEATIATGSAATGVAATTATGAVVVVTEATASTVAIVLASGVTVKALEIPLSQLSEVPISAADVRVDLGDFDPRNKCLQEFLENGFTLVRALNGEGVAIRHFLQKGKVIIRIDFTRVNGKLVEVGAHIVEHFGRVARYLTFGSPKKNLTFVKKTSLKPYTHIRTGCTPAEWLTFLFG